MTIKNIPITIIIPTLNEELNLPRLLDDLTRQSYTNFKVIVVDANSTDKTVFRTKQYKSKLALKVFVTKKKGVAYQRNFGAKNHQQIYFCLWMQITEYHHTLFRV